MFLACPEWCIHCHIEPQVRERLLFEDMDRASWFSAAGVSGLEVGRTRNCTHSWQRMADGLDCTPNYVIVSIPQNPGPQKKQDIRIRNRFVQNCYFFNFLQTNPLHSPTKLLWWDSPFQLFSKLNRLNWTLIHIPVSFVDLQVQRLLERHQEMHQVTAVSCDYSLTEAGMVGSQRC